ncbi:MAG: BsuBI/PstI family type II restriction endonuclease [Gemmatimonadaceae bacterium]
MKALGLPKAQTNERAAIVLLALLDLRGGRNWVDAQAPLMGIRPIMDYAAAHLGKKWAENTRETVRRFTVHQFVQAGVCLRNPDDLTRATNSPDTVYQIAPMLLGVLRQYGQPTWDTALAEYLAVAGRLADEYKAARDVQRIPLSVDGIPGLTLTPGGQNELVRATIEGFVAIFTRAPHPVYIGDTGDKLAWFDQAYLAELGVTVESHGQIPDLVIHDRERDWLILIEAVTSHGPMSAKRIKELKTLFAGSQAGLVFVTAFLTRKAFTTYLPDIAWETEVWIAEDPTHMIHFNGERFLGPYEAADAATD